MSDQHDRSKFLKFINKHPKSIFTGIGSVATFLIFNIRKIGLLDKIDANTIIKWTKNLKSTIENGAAFCIIICITIIIIVGLVIKAVKYIKFMDVMQEILQNHPSIRRVSYKHKKGKDSIHISRNENYNKRDKEEKVIPFPLQENINNSEEKK